MTRRDYELIASAINESGINKGSAERIALVMASKLASDNPAFNREKFLKAALND